MQLSKEDILSQRLPLVDLLVDSLYYPNSRLDGGVIKYSTIICEMIKTCMRTGLFARMR